MSFFAELKRRNVFRVAAAYVVLAWVLLQVGDVVFEAMRLDEAANTILLVILALGLIPALVFAWALELTPEGVRWDSGQASMPPAATSRKLDIAVPDDHSPVQKADWRQRFHHRKTGTRSDPEVALAQQCLDARVYDFGGALHADSKS